ncbi:MAG: DUF3224 domain-containing protein [Chloroherpetonaceae bacterium]|nr:DUF3224 domain-containing protein [Chloroherpetonaceae bacterium]
MHTTGSITVHDWQEQTLLETSPENKITSVVYSYQFTGNLEGTGKVTSQMYYEFQDPKDGHKSRCLYHSFIHFSGKLDGKQGSFLIAEIGLYDEGKIMGDIAIVKDSGRGELKGIEGVGHYEQSERGFIMHLDYQLLEG